MIYAGTGRLAFGADSVPAVMHRIMYEEPDVSSLPPSLRTVVLQCLDKDPDRRPSARDLLLRLVDPSVPRAPAGFPAQRGAAGRALRARRGPGAVPADASPGRLRRRGRRYRRPRRRAVHPRIAARLPGRLR